jgi:hypothetical protein
LGDHQVRLGVLRHCMAGSQRGAGRGGGGVSQVWGSCSWCQPAGVVQTACVRNVSSLERYHCNARAT